MNLIFIDISGRAYDTRTGLTEPLGGTQAAVAGLSKAMAENGHSLTVINNVKEKVNTDGVNFLPAHSEIKINDYDAVITVSAVMGEQLRGMGCTKPLILWMHHDANQPCVQGLNSHIEKSRYNGFVFVSDWQAKRYFETFAIPTEKTKVLRNAVSKPFEDVLTFKENTPVLAYSSTPFRGLDLLLTSFPLICKYLPNAKLKIFSGMEIYGQPNDEFEALYELAQGMEGVKYIGALSQTDLAEEMAYVDIWAYPCTFPETSCISAMESMAAGCKVMCFDSGALKETTAGFARMIPPCSPTQYARFIINEWQNIKPSQVWGGMDYAQENYTWAKRAKEWESWLEGIIK